MNILNLLKTATQLINKSELSNADQIKLKDGYDS